MKSETTLLLKYVTTFELISNYNLNFPFTIQIGTTKILWHVLLETIGFITGYGYFVYLRAKQSDTIENENRTWILIGATFGALLDCRLIGGLENPPDLLALPQKNAFRQK